LRTVTIQDARLSVIDEKNGARWRGDDAAFDLERDDAKLSFQAQAGLVGAQGPPPFLLPILTHTRFNSASIEARVKGARPGALAPGVALLANLSTPTSVKIDIGLDRKVGVTRLDGAVDLGAGTLTLGGGTLALAGGRLSGRYDLAADTLY